MTKIKSNINRNRELSLIEKTLSDDIIDLENQAKKLMKLLKIKSNLLDQDFYKIDNKNLKSEYFHKKENLELYIATLKAQAELLGKNKLETEFQVKRLWRKFKRNPKRYLQDSKYSYFRFLSKFLPERQL